MAKVISTLFSSADGVAELDPDWHFPYYDENMGRQLGDVRKVVVSRQPLEFSWRNSELIEGDLAEAVTALKTDAGIGGILIPGSISVVPSCAPWRRVRGAGCSTTAPRRIT